MYQSMTLISKNFLDEIVANAPYGASSLVFWEELVYKRDNQFIKLHMLFVCKQIANRM